ncbi:MAG: helix-turn-helix domain-containing protein [Paludibacter sp.]|nr:helix-turn-helix domain-containing protein [Paludibacter sp.]
MAYLTVDEDGKEAIHSYKPIRQSGLMDDNLFWWSGEKRINLPPGTIKKLTGEQLTWNDEPVELIDHESLTKRFTIRICNESGCDIDKLYNHYKHGNEAKARQLIIAFRRVVLRLSLAESASEFGRDHATALHSIRTVQSDYQTSSDYRKLFGDVFNDYPELLSYKIGNRVK